MHLTPDTVSWELFEERFRKKYLPAYYQEQQVGAFHALVQGGLTVEEYEGRFMELVKYVSYMDSDEHQAERFVYGLNQRIRAHVRMWHPTSVAEAVQNARYAEELESGKRDQKGGIRSTTPQQSGYGGKAPRPYYRGGNFRPSPYGYGGAPRAAAPMAASVVSQTSSRAYGNPR